MFTVASALASAVAIALGIRRGHPLRSLVADLASLGAVYVVVFVIAQSETRLGGDAALALLALMLGVRAAVALAAFDARFPTIAIDPRKATIAFVAINGALVLLLLLWPFPGCEIGCSMRARWVPFALALATALTLLLARGRDALPLYRSHAALWLAVPLAFALTSWRGEPQSLVGVPVVAIVVGVAAMGVIELWRTADVRGDRATGLLLGATVLAASLSLLAWVRTVQPTESDEPHYLVAMQSLVEDRDLDLKNEYDRADYADYYPGRLPDRHIVEVGKTEVPIRDPGLPLIGAIPFALGRRTGVLALMSVVVALFAWRGYALLRRLGFRRDAAVLAVAIVALLHPLFTYTTQVYPDAIGALVVLLAAEQLAAPIRPRRLAIASALLGLLPWLSVRHWFIAVGMGLVVAALAFAPLFRGRTRGAAIGVIAGAAPFAALVGGYALLDLALFGVPVPNAGYFVIRDQYYVVSYTPWIGLPGLLLDRTFGLLSHTPLYALAFVGAVPLWRRWRAHRSPAIAALFLGWLLYLVYVADISYWWADGAPSSRYQLASIAFLLVAVAAAIEVVRDLRSEAVRTVALAGAGIAAAWSVGVALVYALAPNVRYDIAADIAQGGSPGFLWVVVTKLLRANVALLFPSMVRGAAIDYALAGAWAIVLVALAVAGARAAGSARTLAHTSERA